jgi:methylsterol monooxygenase
MRKNNSRANPFPVVSNVTAFLVSYFVTVPTYNTYLKPVLDTADNGMLNKFASFTVPWLYDPRKDHFFNMMYMASIMGFYSMTFIGAALDCFPGIFLKYKTQGKRSYCTIWEWLEANLVGGLNLFVVAWSVNLPCCYLWKTLHGSAYNLNGNPKTEEFNVALAIVHIIVCHLVIDSFFWTAHRLLHVQPFYSWIHKFHHHFTAPTSVTSIYANPIEFAIGNHLGVVLGPMLVNPHPYTAFFWFFQTLFSTGGSHSGYFFLGAEDHDLHHELFNVNYGVGGIVDYLLGTNYIGPKRMPKQNAGRKKMQ